MRKDVFVFLANYSKDPTVIDRLIVSAFIVLNKMTVRKNQLIQDTIIHKSKCDEYAALLKFISIIEEQKVDFTVEELIVLFEFVISPSDKTVNGAVYTPSDIREYIVRTSIDQLARPTNEILACDFTCGCGGFLLTIATIIQELSGNSLYNIYRDNIFGLDITEYSVHRSKLLLTLYALKNGEDLEFDFNISTGNALSFNWLEEIPIIRENEGFDLIAGNPPYVCSRHMNAETRSLVDNWSVCKSGHPDLYIPFFQIGYTYLNANGVMGLITVNTFIKSVNGRALRKFFSDEKIDLTIINFGGEQIFKGRNTYTCLCFLKKESIEHDQVKYFLTSRVNLVNLDGHTFQRFDYSQLNANSGWNLVNNIELFNFLKAVEKVGIPFEMLYKTKNGIATLLNDVYKFLPEKEDRKYYYFTTHQGSQKIEKAICRDIVNSNKLKTEVDLFEQKEKIIFPYKNENGGVVVISETEMKRSFPFTLEYLSNFKTELANRDKGKKMYPTWYAYGRRQSMDLYKYKLFFPHICDRPTFVLSSDPMLLFYNGIAVVSDSLSELKTLKCILESNLFYEYVKNATKDYSSGYISLSRNYIKNFGIINLSADQKAELIISDNPNTFINELYQTAFSINGNIHVDMNFLK